MKKKILKFGLGLSLIMTLTSCNTGDIIAGDNSSNDSYYDAGTFPADGGEFEGDLGGWFDILEIFSGNFNFGTDKDDWYKHSAEEEGIFAVSFKLTSEPDEAVSLSLYNATSLDTPSKTLSTAVSNSKRSIVIFQSSDEQYYFKVSLGDGTKEVNYKMQGVETTSLTSVAESSNANDDKDSAESLSTLETTKIKGYLKDDNNNDDNDTVDYYKFTASDDGIVYVKLADVASVYNASLHARDSSDNAISNTSISDGGDMSFSVSKGKVYYIKVSTTDTTSSAPDTMPYYITTHFIAN